MDDKYAENNDCEVIHPIDMHGPRQFDGDSEGEVIHPAVDMHGPLQFDGDSKGEVIPHVDMHGPLQNDGDSEGEVIPPVDMHGPLQFDGGKVIPPVDLNGSPQYVNIRQVLYCIILLLLAYNIIYKLKLVQSVYINA